MKLEDLLELEKWECMYEVPRLFDLCSTIHANPNVQYEIHKHALQSKDVSESLGRSWLFEIRYSDVNNRSTEELYSAIASSTHNLKAQHALVILKSFVQPFSNDLERFDAPLKMNFVEPRIIPPIECYCWKGIPFAVTNKIEYLRHLSFFGPYLHELIQRYMGIKNIVYQESHYRDLLKTKIRAIGHVLFSTKDFLRWNQKKIADDPVFQILAKDCERYRERPSNRTIIDALKSIIPENCRGKKGNRAFGIFYDAQINQNPLPLPNIILPSKNGTKVNFMLVNIVVNCVIVTRAKQLSQERSSLCPEELLALPVLSQIQKHLNSQEKKIFRYGTLKLLKE
jgi:hypothetical protein